MRREAQIQQVQPSACNVIPFSEMNKMISKRERKPKQEEVIAVEIREAIAQTRLIIESGNPLKTCLESTLNSISLAIRIETAMTDFSMIPRNWTIKNNPKCQ